MQIIIDVIKQILRGILLAEETENAYLCNVFFIVLDLRLTKVGVQRTFFLCPYFPSPQNASAFVLKRKDISTKT